MPTLAEILAKKAKASPVSSGTVIRAEDEKAKLAATIKQSLDATAPKPAPPLPHSEERELGAMEKGERIPMDYPAQEDGDSGAAWFRSLHSFETTLGIVIEPDTDQAWLAVQPTKFEQPLLILSLPLLNRRKDGNPF